MKYEMAPDLDKRAHEIIDSLEYNHVDKNRIACIRSYGSKTRGTVARIHGSGKVFDFALGIKPCYVIEFLSEKFDRMNSEEQAKTILHEIMHIPHNFGGGFRHHKPYVNARTVNREYGKFLDVKRESKKLEGQRLEV